MRYKILLTHTAIGSDSGICEFSAKLADRLNAAVIGITGARLTPPLSEVPVADMMEFEREAAEKSIASAEARFRSAFRGTEVRLEWRSSCEYAPVADFIAREARAADLIVTSPETGGMLERLDETRIGPLVLQAGRPVLIVPKGQTVPKLQKAVIAWKDSRESRRAVADALSLLEQYAEITVVEVCRPAQREAAHARVADVAAWLETHGIKARSVVQDCEGRDLDGLYKFLRQEGCDLVVAGAYGHTRLQEWIFGGVTMDLLLPAEYCVLLSH